MHSSGDSSHNAVRFVGFFLLVSKIPSSIAANSKDMEVYVTWVTSLLLEKV